MKIDCPYNLVERPWVEQLELGVALTTREQVKLSASVGSDGFFRAFWVGPGLLLTSSGEQLLRFWDLGNDVNYVLSISEAGSESNVPIPRRDEVSAVAYCQSRGGLGTPAARRPAPYSRDSVTYLANQPSSAHCWRARP